MRAEIIAVGTEILLGEIVDTNSAHIASRLPELGIDVYLKHTVGDNLARLASVIEQARANNDLVITTGGLGPTEDDLTREAIAAVMGEEVAIDPGLETQLRAFFGRRGGSQMPERNLKQAWLISSAHAIANPRGTAPGWWVERDGKIVIAMPGPPSEMTRMWDEEVAPQLRIRSTGSVLVKRTLKTVGIGEGAVDELLSPLLKSTNPSIGVYARSDGVHVRFGAKAPTAGEAAKLIEPLETQAKITLGDAIWGVDDETFESVIGQMLKGRGLTLALMESCTGGQLADLITNVAGSSAYFRGGIVAYSTKIKEMMGVEPELIREHGVISDATAGAMAAAARERLDADIGIGVTGVAGPDAQDGIAAGQIHVGIDGGSHFPALAQSYHFNQSREANKRRAVTQALMLLRRSLLAME